MERRNTVQKQLVLNAVRQLMNHATADEIYQYIKGLHPSVGKGTVYRNLSILADEGLIRRVEISNGSDCYDHNISNHYHVKCIKCGKVFDVDMDVLPDLRQNIRDCHGIKFLDFDILFKGICPSCQEKER